MEFFNFTSLASTFGQLLETIRNVGLESPPPPTYLDSLWLYLLIGGICYAIVYVFETIALCTISKREGFRHRWMAFLPFFNTYYIGVVSEKNRTFGTKTKYVSLAAAIAEAVCVGLYVLVYVVQFRLLDGGYLVAQINSGLTTTTEYPVYSYMVVGLPTDMAWMGWICENLNYYIISWVELLYVIAHMFVLIAFFRTYSPSGYIVYAILCIFFPIKGIFMFALRNRTAKNYTEYLREQSQRRYAQYQEYMRNNGQGPDAYGNYGAGGTNPYAQRPATPPGDPFGGLGTDRPQEDPFEDLSASRQSTTQPTEGEVNSQQEQPPEGGGQN